MAAQRDRIDSIFKLEIWYADHEIGRYIVQIDQVVDQSGLQSHMRLAVAVDRESIARQPSQAFLHIHDADSGLPARRACAARGTRQMHLEIISHCFFRKSARGAVFKDHAHDILHGYERHARVVFELDLDQIALLRRHEIGIAIIGQRIDLAARAFGDPHQTPRHHRHPRALPLTILHLQLCRLAEIGREHLRYRQASLGCGKLFAAGAHLEDATIGAIRKKRA